MISYKNNFYVLSLLLALFSISSLKSTELGELQVRKYITHLLDNLFLPQNHPVTHQQHLHNFSQELTNMVTRNLGTFPHFYSFSKTYNDHEVYQQVIQESLLFIEKNMRNGAINAVQNYYGEATNSQKKLVDKIVTTLMKEIRTKVNKNALLSEGIFTIYFGNVLTTRIQFLIDKELKKEAERLEKLNVRTRCSLCSVHYNAEANKKITLHCGHAVCLVCLKELWNKMHSNIACTQCHAKINISEHVGGIWTTPANYDENYYYNDDTDYSSEYYSTSPEIY